MEPVEPEIRHDRLAVVTVDPQPRAEVGILAYRRSTACAVVAVRGSQLADGPTEVQRPGVQECRVRIGIERPFLGQSRGGPVLPPVEIPLEALIQAAFVAIEVPRPGTPRHLVGAPQIAEVVDLEAG